jgi:hypothetical protein
VKIIKKKLVIRILIIFLIGIVALSSIIFGIRYYKKAQLNDCITNIQVEDVYAITIRYYYESKYDLGGITRDPITATIKDEIFIKDFLLLLKKQSFKYSGEISNNRSYSTGENIQIMIGFHNKKSITFDVRKYKYNNKLLMWVSSDYLHDISSIYKLSYNTGTGFFDWIVQQVNYYRY